MGRSYTKIKQKGFTLLEILLVVAAIAILAGIVIVAINPNKQLGDARNAERRADINTILNGVYQYAIDNGGVLPSMPTGACALVAENQICKGVPAGTCSAGVDLSVLIDNQVYLTSLPVDPTVSSADGTGYYISRSANGRVSVCAPSAEQEAVISVTR